MDFGPDRCLRFLVACSSLGARLAFLGGCSRLLEKNAPERRLRLEKKISDLILALTLFLRLLWSALTSLTESFSSKKPRQVSNDLDRRSCRVSSPIDLPFMTAA